MARIGFLFRVIDDFYVVLVNKQNLRKDVIVGFENFLPKEIKSYLYLSEELVINSYEVEDSKIKYGKICANDKKIVSFQDHLFWFGGTKYREIYQLLIIDSFENLEEEFKIRCNDLFSYF